MTRRDFISRIAGACAALAAGPAIAIALSEAAPAALPTFAEGIPIAVFPPDVLKEGARLMASEFQIWMDRALLEHAVNLTALPQ